MKRIARALRKLDLYLVTIGHLRPDQVYHRARRVCRSRLLTLAAHPLPAPIETAAKFPLPFAMETAAPDEEANHVLAGEFHFIQFPPVAMDPVDWQCAPDNSLLWLFNLQYFHFGVSLARAYRATSDERYLQKLIGLMLDWVQRNPMPRGAAWHPYPTSRRLVAWAEIVALLQDVPAFRKALPRLLASIVQQASHLLSAREYELRGNHLLANLHALYWVRLTFADVLPAELTAALEPVCREFWTEFLEQTKPDGSHEENSLSYQMIVCQDAFEAMLLADAVGPPVDPPVKARLEKMFEHLMALVKPDGSLPMVNDTMQGYPMPALDFLAAGALYFRRSDFRFVAANADTSYVRWLFGEEGVRAFGVLSAKCPAETSFAFPESGYYVIRDGWDRDSDYLLFDCGPLGPRHLMGHAHADTLSLEICSLGRSIVLDPGVYEYRAGAWRDRFRSTAAHNTVTVDDMDQSEIWAAFRVARRAEASLEEWKPGHSVAGAHDGYLRLHGKVTHRRQVFYVGHRHWRIIDRLSSQSGVHRYVLNLQLAPGSVARVAGPGEVEVTTGAAVKSRYRIEGPEGLSVDLASGWVSERLHEKITAPAIQARYTGNERVLEFTTEILVEKEMGMCG